MTYIKATASQDNTPDLATCSYIFIALIQNLHAGVKWSTVCNLKLPLALLSQWVVNRQHALENRYMRIQQFKGDFNQRHIRIFLDIIVLQKINTKDWPLLIWSLKWFLLCTLQCSCMQAPHSFHSQCTFWKVTPQLHGQHQVKCLMREPITQS